MSSPSCPAPSQSLPVPFLESMPPPGPANPAIEDQMYLDALNHASRVNDLIQAAAADGTVVLVYRTDSRVTIRALKGDQDLYVTKAIHTNYASVIPSDAPRQVTVSLDTSTLEFVMGAITTVNKNYDILITDTTVRADATSGPILLTLPEGSTVGAVKIVKKIDATGNAVVVDGGGVNIDVNPQLTITAQNRAVWFQWNGAWWDLLVTQALF